jgi:2-keto-4-pentenoate hydratase
MTAPNDPPVITDRGRPIFGVTPPGHGIPCDRDTPLSEAELDEVVELIASAREERRAALMPPELMTRDWPSVVQVVLRLDERLGWAPAGWKIGAASEEIRRSEGLPGPSPGRIYLDSVFRSPAVLPPALFINYRNVECELAFRLDEGFAIRDEPYTEEEVDARIECLMPTLEIGDMVFEDWYGASGYFGSCFDNGGGAALVCGPEIDDWRGLGPPLVTMAASPPGGGTGMLIRRLTGHSPITEIRRRILLLLGLRHRSFPPDCSECLPEHSRSPSSRSPRQREIRERRP